MNVSRLNDDLTVALVWLTRLPVSFPDSAEDRQLAQAVWAFPLVGLILGAMTLFIWGVASTLGLPPLLAAALTVAAMILMTGGLHEDGLADFCDGLGARGDRAKKLAAMRDSAIGTYGVLALVSIFAIRTIALAELGEPIVLVTVCVLSRTWMAGVMQHYPLARTDGAAHGAGVPDDFIVYRAYVISAAVVLLTWMVAPIGLAGVILVPLLGLAVALFIARKAMSAFGGVTGDVLGAVCLVSETAMLVLMTAILAN